MPAHKILILDFGSQYSQLIARRVRELGVYCELHPHTLPREKIEAFSPCGIIFSGGPASVTDQEAPQIPGWILQGTLPLLGICYGMQAMAFQLGGEVTPSDKKEFGFAEVYIHTPTALFESLGKTLGVWMSHGDRVEKVPSGFIAIAASENTPIVAMAHETKPFYGVQFHPEVTHTEKGKEILGHFVHQICGAPSTWHASHIMERLLFEIQNQVGSSQVILGLRTRRLTPQSHQKPGHLHFCGYGSPSVGRGPPGDPNLPRASGTPTGSCGS
jgi:GMP synthase (glutamine-hydrolysing)